MAEKKQDIRKSALLRNNGWKRNILGIVIGFFVCFILEILTSLVSGVRVISQFDPSIAVLPIIGFLLGIWGIIGALLENMITLVLVFIAFGLDAVVSDMVFVIPAILSLVLYCALPALLWYLIRLPGEEIVTYPRLDTSAHVAKYYFIMVISVAVYMFLSALSVNLSFKGLTVSGLVASFTQYLDVVLIVGMPILILVSVIRHRTITINERMVLAFLFIGVIASAMATYLVYKNTLYLAPGVFEDYERMAAKQFEEMTESDTAVITRYNDFWNRFYIAIAIMLNGLLLVEMLFMRNIEKRVTKPLVHLADVLGKYTGTEDESLNPEIVKNECQNYSYGYGEVSSLTRTCVNMVSEIDDYTQHIRQATANTERIGTELNIASKIQRDMLPGIFPPFPERKEVDVFASMIPAKEVGGDFYDFYFIDRDHLALTIADVSDKGVPASLFMVISKTLLKNHAQTGSSPKEILTYVNHQLCQNNTSFMFCTVWLGILDVRTGKLVASNAGHEYPAIRKKDGDFELVMGRHDPPLGIRDGYRFNDYELSLSPGDILFEYTDGVTEAENIKEEGFGEDRLIETLNRYKEGTPEEVIRGVNEAIDNYIGEAARFDDTTMICLTYRGSEDPEEAEVKRSTLRVPASIDQLDELTEFIQTELEKAGCRNEDLFTITLAAEEIFVNIANYAYDGRDGMVRIDFSFKEKDRWAELQFSDTGIPFDPTIRTAPDITLQAKDRPVGGLGIYIVKKTMDDVKYEYLGGKNILTLGKKI